MKKEEFFDMVFGQFGFGVLQDMANVMKIMIESEVTIEELIAWVKQTHANQNSMLFEYSKRRYLAYLDYKLNSRRCPDCGDIMRAMPVNTGPGDQVGGNYQTVWMCLSKENCGLCEYSEKSILEENILHGLIEANVDPRSSKRKKERSNRYVQPKKYNPRS